MVYDPRQDSPADEQMPDFSNLEPENSTGDADSGPSFDFLGGADVGDGDVHFDDDAPSDEAAEAPADPPASDIMLDDLAADDPVDQPADEDEVSAEDVSAEDLDAAEVGADEIDAGDIDADDFEEDAEDFGEIDFAAPDVSDEKGTDVEADFEPLDAEEPHEPAAVRPDGSAEEPDMMFFADEREQAADAAPEAGAPVAADFVADTAGAGEDSAEEAFGDVEIGEIDAAEIDADDIADEALSGEEDADLDAADIDAAGIEAGGADDEDVEFGGMDAEAASADAADTDADASPEGDFDFAGFSDEEAAGDEGEFSEQQDEDSAADHADAMAALGAAAGVASADDDVGFSTGDASAEDAPPAPKPRPKKKSGGAVGMLIGVFGGGVCGILIAILFIWWILGKDPFQLGPVAANAVPFLVPEEFHGGESETASQDPPAKRNTGDNQERQPRDDGARKPPSGFGEKDRDKPKNRQGTDYGTKLPGVDDQQPPLDEPKIETPGLTPGSGEPPIDEPDIPTPDLPLPGFEPEPKTGPEPAKLGPQFDKTYTAEEMGAHLKAAIDAKADWDGMKDLPAAEIQKKRDAYRAAAAQLFIKFSKLAEVFAATDAKSAGFQGRRDFLHDMLIDIVTDRKTKSLINKVAPQWLKNPPQRRPNQGVVLVGTVTKIEKDGAYYESTIELADGNQTRVVVVSEVSPKLNNISTYYEGDEALILGRIIENPQDNLPGYTGTRPQVVWGSYPVTTSTPRKSG